MSQITIYKDDAANAIFIEDANGVQFINSLQATIDGSDCNVRDLARDIDIVTAGDERGQSNYYSQNPCFHLQILLILFINLFTFFIRFYSFLDRFLPVLACHRAAH